MDTTMSLDDSEEFMTQALATPTYAKDEEEAPRGPRKKNDKKKYSGLSQYASVGGGQGFTPTSDTIKTLVPDSYNLSMTMEGAIVFVPQKIITDNLLRLPDSRSDEVIAEIQRFWTLKDQFKKYGFAHKRGFLLFGPPGSGKTSTVAITIGDMVKNGGLVIFGDNPSVLAKGLAQLRVIEPDRPVVVILEDLDTIIRNYGESTVLALLDGESQIENVVYIATTNYPENLDGRITNRPSRFDRVVKIGLPNAEARGVYIKSRLDTTVCDGVDLVKETEGLSIAHIKELIIGVFCQGNPVSEVLGRLQKMKVLPKSNGDATPMGFGLASK